MMTAEELAEQGAEETAHAFQALGRKRDSFMETDKPQFVLVVSEKHSQRPSDGPCSPSGPPGTANEPGAPEDAEVSRELWMPGLAGFC